MAAMDSREPVFFDLTPRAKLRVTGKDRLRFLNGQLTNNISRATSSAAVAACVLSAKGKTEGYVFVSAGPDSFFLDAEAGQQEKLPARLERYIIADDVQIENVTGDYSIFHLLGAVSPALSGRSRIVSATRFREPGRDVWVENFERDKVFEQLSTACAFRDDQASEVQRIEQGIPRWGREVTEDVIPVEANLEQSCIDYEKGCYIGQEVISRMKMSGQRNKKLAGFVSVHGAPLRPGMKLYAIGDEKKEAGWLTSATHSKMLGKEIALGFVRRPFPPVRFKLDALDADAPLGSALVRVEVFDLPFPNPLID